VATLHVRDFSLIIYCDILNTEDLLINHVKKIIYFVINDLKLNPQDVVILTDREFKNFEMIELFEKYNFNYIGFIPKNSKVKYYFENKYEKGDNWKFNYFINYKIIPKLVIAEDEIITNSERKKVYYTFLTNLNFENPESYIKLYKKRWNIETRFRILKDVIIKTKSTSPKVRLFLFIIRCIIHNLWIKIRNNEYESISLKLFIIEINELLHELEFYSCFVVSNTQLCMFNAYS